MPVRRLLFLIVSLVIITAIHFVISIGTHPLHVFHILFRTLYLIPVIAGAVWFGRRGGLATAIGAAASYSSHILLSWSNQPMENANQVAMVGIFLVVGVVAGALVDQKEQERRRRLETERRARRAAIVQGIAGLASALKFRDAYTRRHSDRVAHVAVEIGRARNLPAERLELLHLAALVHDVGKIGVRDDVLFKPDELTSTERALIERHPIVAAEILAAMEGTREVADIVLAHHECPDGSGYPKGLTADQIPVEAAILRVADVFSALTDGRPYKPAMATEAALAWMQFVSGTKLDAESVSALHDVSHA